MVKSIIRTPEERFEHLEDYDYQPNYTTCLGYRIHFVDEGSKEGPIVLLLHGEPSWSYLYRHMIPLLVDEGFRVIAPDLLGFGKSDKLKHGGQYSYQLLVDIKTAFIQNLDTDIAVLFIQDWGALIGLRLMETIGNRINRVLLSNGALPAASGWQGWLGHLLFKLRIKLVGKITQDELEEDTNFLRWVAFTQTVDSFPVGEIIQGASNRKLTESEIEAYNAPFPDETYKEGARQLPMLVTSQLRKNFQVWQNTLKKWEKPFLTVFGEGDPITSGNERKFIREIPGAQNLEHKILENASHFIQEDKPEDLVREITQLYKNT